VGRLAAHVAHEIRNPLATIGGFTRAVLRAPQDTPRVERNARIVLEEVEGIEVVGEAGDGDEALALARELEPDVVVLDVTMPGRTGLEVARELRADGGDSAIVMLSLISRPPGKNSSPLIRTING